MEPSRPTAPGTPDPWSRTPGAGLSGSEPAWPKRAPRSCGPTPGVAPARAALRAAGFRSYFSARLFSRAPLGNLVKTCQHILTISLLRRRRAIWFEGTALGPRRPHVPWTGETYVSLRPCLLLFIPRGNATENRSCGGSRCSEATIPRGSLKTGNRYPGW